MGEKRLNLALTSGTADIARLAASRLGFLIHNGGPMAGQGNVSELFRAVLGGSLDCSALADALEAARAEVGAGAAVPAEQDMA
jgi:hypothetical protein